mgnify:CR=1 FL=1
MGHSGKGKIISPSGADKQRDQQCGCSDRQAQIGFPAAVFPVLPLLFIHIEPGKADQSTQDISGSDHRRKDGLSGTVIADHGRQNTKADQVAERIDLNAKTFLLSGSFHGGSDLTVKHITKACCHETQQCSFYITGGDAQNTGKT